MAGAQSQGSDAHVQDSQEAKQYNLAGLSGPNQGEQAAGQPMCPAAADDKHRTSRNGQHMHGCTALDVYDEQKLPAASSNCEPPLALLLPELTIARGSEHAASIAGLKQAPLAVPIQAAAMSKTGSAPLQLNTSLAAEHAMQLSTIAAASPEQQRVWLRAFLYKQLRLPDGDGAIHAHWPPALELRMTHSGLRKGGMAERLFRRMGSTPAAAALLRSLICPLTKVRCAVLCCALRVWLMPVSQ